MTIFLGNEKNCSLDASLDARFSLAGEPCMPQMAPTDGFLSHYFLPEPLGAGLKQQLLLLAIIPAFTDFTS